MEYHSDQDADDQYGGEVKMTRMLQDVLELKAIEQRGRQQVETRLCEQFCKLWWKLHFAIIAFCENFSLWGGEILNFIGNLEVLFAPALWNYSQVQVASKPNHKTCKHHVNLPPQKRNHLKGDLPKKKSKDVGVMFEEPCLPPPQPKCFPNCLRIATGERWRWAAVK